MSAPGNALHPHWIDKWKEVIKEINVACFACGLLGLGYFLVLFCVFFFCILKVERKERILKKKFFFDGLSKKEREY